MNKETVKIIEAYKFAMTEATKVWVDDRSRGEMLSCLAALAHKHLIEEGVDAEEIMEEILGENQQ